MTNNSSVKIDDELHLKLKKYVETLKKHDIKRIDAEKNKAYEITSVSIVNKLLEDYFKNKIVSNTDYIIFKQPFYYNLSDLYNNKEVEATIKEPSKVRNMNIIKEMPNNLDTFNKKFESYCYSDSEYLHKGIQFIVDPIYETKFKGIETNILLYEYDSKENILNIYDIDFEDLHVFLNQENYYKVMNNFNYELALLKHLFKEYNENVLFDWCNSKNNLACNDYASNKMLSEIPVIYDENITLDDADYIDITPPSFIYFKDNLIHYDFTKAVFNGKEDSLINFDLNKAYGINLFEYD